MTGEAMPTGREKPGEHWNARLIREEAEAAGGKTYTPKVGDRVRVTYEGVVGSRGTDGFALVDNPGWHYVDAPTIEKLQDPIPPEPEWVNGDVILIIGEAGKRTPMIYVRNSEGDRFWACAECSRGAHPIQHVSADWSNGDVEILYKADGQAPPA